MPNQRWSVKAESKEYWQGIIATLSSTLQHTDAMNFRKEPMRRDVRGMRVCVIPKWLLAAGPRQDSNKSTNPPSPSWLPVPCISWTALILDLDRFSTCETGIGRCRAPHRSNSPEKGSHHNVGKNGPAELGNKSPGKYATLQGLSSEKRAPHMPISGGPFFPTRGVYPSLDEARCGANALCCTGTRGQCVSESPQHVKLSGRSCCTQYCNPESQGTCPVNLRPM